MRFTILFPSCLIRCYLSSSKHSSSHMNLLTSSQGCITVQCFSKHPRHRACPAYTAQPYIRHFMLRTLHALNQFPNCSSTFSQQLHSTVYWVYNWTKSHVYKTKLILSQSRVGTKDWGSITGLWGSSEVRGSQPSHCRGVATG